jgi:hypothetical protein
MRGRATIAAVTLATLDLACATGPALRDPQAHIAATRLAALPAALDVFVWGREGRRLSDRELTETVRGNVDESINYRLRSHGGRSFGSAATSRLEHFTDFYRWSLRTMHEIMAERLGDAPAAHRSVAEWRFPAALSSWRTALNADFVLVSFILYGDPGQGFSPARSDPARGMAIEGSGLTGSGSRAIACVVALDGGRVVWCNFIPNNSVNMQQRAAAQSTVDVLLEEMLQLADRS